MQRDDYQRGMYLQGAMHPVQPPYTKGMMLKGGPVNARLLKKRKTPDTSLAEIEERLNAARAKLNEIVAAVRRK